MKMTRPLLVSLATALLMTAGAADAQHRHGGGGASGGNGGGGYGGPPGWTGRGGPPPWAGRGPMRPDRDPRDPRLMRPPLPREIDPRVRPRRLRDQDAAFAARRAGEIRSLRDIESRVVPRMRGADYLGPEFDDSSATYRLKFMRGGSVIWLDVDGRTGQVIGRSGE